MYADIYDISTPIEHQTSPCTPRRQSSRCERHLYDAQCKNKHGRINLPKDKWQYNWYGRRYAAQVHSACVPGGLRVTCLLLAVSISRNVISDGKGEVLALPPSVKGNPQISTFLEFQFFPIVCGADDLCSYTPITRLEIRSI